MIDIIIAPPTAPQVYVPPLGGVAHPLAPEVMQAMRQHGNGPVGLWKVINGLAKARQPQGRDQRRCLCLRFWGAVRELLRFKVLVRHGPLIATSNFATRPKPRAAGRRSPRPVNSKVHLFPSVGASTIKLAGSNRTAPMPETAATDRQVIEGEVISGATSMTSSAPDTKSAMPAEISAAASALAKRPRKVKRRWTGYLDGERVKRGTLVQVPGGDILPVYVMLRGKLLVVSPYADRVFDRYDADQVRRVKLPEAQLLGSRKAGTVERRSEAKARAARLNGLRPCRPGKRRGWPSLHRFGQPT